MSLYFSFFSTVSIGKIVIKCYTVTVFMYVKKRMEEKNMANKSNSVARQRRHARVRNKVSGTAECPRLNVFRSNSHIFAQIIDDEKGTTLVSSSSVELKLKNGGNAMDAAIAMALTSGVVLPDMCSFGADAFMLHYDGKTHKITAINGSSYAPKKATLQYFKDQGYTKIPNEGPLSITCPGAVDTYFTSLDLFGTRSFQELAQDAIDLARNGVPASEKVVRHMHTDLGKMRRFKELSELYLNHNEPYLAGDILYNEAYAKCIEYVCENGRDG